MKFYHQSRRYVEFKFIKLKVGQIKANLPSSRPVDRWVNEDEPLPIFCVQVLHIFL